MIGYASRTGTKVNRAALWEAGWRLLLTPRGGWDPRHHGEPWPYAIDNGAWSEKGAAFDPPLFLRLVERYGAGADWIVLPDMVAGGVRSLELSLSWLPRLRGAAPLLLLPVQDGGHGVPDMRLGDVRPEIGPEVGIFVGGSTEWKDRTIRAWGELAQEVGAHCHAGRVNTIDRLERCARGRLQSFDGSGVSRMVKALHFMERHRARVADHWPRQAALPLEES